MLLQILPLGTHHLYLIRINGHMCSDHMRRGRTSIGQTCHSSTVQLRNRHNETMMYLLWMCGNIASAGSLLQRNIGHNNILSEEQRRFQSKNFWTIEQASQRGLNHFRQDNRQSLLRILLMHRVKIVEQCKELAPCRCVYLSCPMRQVKIV